jgi:valyl-tRNA synthetase
VQALEELGNVVKVEDYKNKVGYSERTNAVIEPKLSLQWFLKMDTISKPALDNVLNGEIKLIPEKFINTYKHWMEGVHDWCISRQLWWGQRIPAWYDSKGDCVVAKTEAEALDLFKIKNPNSEIGALQQDEDVLDTWFSSWLWPISVFDGFKDPGNKDIQYYYPTNDLITAPEILFFWVARMIIAGYEYRKEKPFTNVYLTGIVRDKLGRKMSKSLGNSPDPLDLIPKYSADGVRVGMLLCSPAGNDLLFDESYCEQGRNFANKIWNAFRLIKSWTTDDSEPSEKNKISIDWFNAKLNAETGNINNLYDKYRISEALMASYKLVWDDFCSWYLEMVKPDFADGKPLPVDRYTYASTIEFFEDLLKIIHPFMPFISEELWHLVDERAEEDCIVVAEWPVVQTPDQSLLDEFIFSSEIVTQVRNIRQQKNISPKEKLLLILKTATPIKNRFDEIIIKLANLSGFEHTEHKIEHAISFMIHHHEFYIPFSAAIDLNAERERLMQELEYAKGFLKSVQSKLANERFVSSAKPDVVAVEKKKESDALTKIKAIEEQLSSYTN